MKRKPRLLPRLARRIRLEFVMSFPHDGF